MAPRMPIRGARNRHRRDAPAARPLDWGESGRAATIADERAAYFVAIAFCMAMALTIGWVSRRDRLNADAAIGIVLVGSLAWGFVTLAIYQHARRDEGVAVDRTGEQFSQRSSFARIVRRSLRGGGGSR